MKKVLIAYIPVIHQGYLDLITKTKPDTIFILGSDFTQEFAHLSKDIRALNPHKIRKILRNLTSNANIKVLNKKQIKAILGEKPLFILPNEDIMRGFTEKYLEFQQIQYKNFFLRWDKDRSLKKNRIKFTRKISSESFAQNVLKNAYSESEKSSDWWRQIGAIIVKKGKIILSGYNRHVPSEHLPYINGDPRNNFHKGINIDLSTSLHAEAGLIAEAARKGVSLRGTDMYVTTFPCPPCAKLIAYSGINKLYYAEGYSMLDGEYILKANNVEINQVELNH